MILKILLNLVPISTRVPTVHRSETLEQYILPFWSGYWDKILQIDSTFLEPTHCYQKILISFTLRYHCDTTLDKCSLYTVFPLIRDGPQISAAL